MKIYYKCFFWDFSKLYIKKLYFVYILINDICSLIQKNTFWVIGINFAFGLTSKRQHQCIIIDSCLSNKIDNLYKQYAGLRSSKMYTIVKFNRFYNEFVNSEGSNHNRFPRNRFWVPGPDFARENLVNYRFISNARICNNQFGIKPVFSIRFLRIWIIS